MKTYIPVLQQDQTFANWTLLLVCMAALLLLLGGSYGGCQAGPLQGLSCPGCLQKEHSIVCTIHNSLVDFLLVSHKSYAFKGFSTLGCKSYQISANHMILLGWSSWKKSLKFSKHFYSKFPTSWWLPAA